MFVPFITPKRLQKRKGGGARGGGSVSSGGGSSGGGSGRAVSVSGSSSSFGGRTTASAGGNGGGSPITLPAGSAFAGRSAGGGTRGQVYGTPIYGSGYPGYAGRGTAGLGFPFFFWPLSFGAFGGAAYHHNNEYGRPDNASRPGGVMSQATFVSSASTNPSTFYLLADKDTTTSLIQSINEDTDCSSKISNPGSIQATPYDGNSTQSPQPESAVQFYRASSVALLLNGYNNTGALSEDENTPMTPLPNNIDTALLDCLNTTIGDTVPLIDGASGLNVPVGTLGLVGIVVWALGLL